MPHQSTTDTPSRRSPMHREILQLVILSMLAVGAFFLTRAIARNNRAMELRDAAEWFQRGEEQFAGGELDAAIASFRRATARNRREKRYALALASALAREGQQEAARSTLLSLRGSSPEDPDVNIQLARLAVARQDVPEAIRYYHDTLYAPWPPERADARRRLRLELIDFMLEQGHTRGALAELMALTSDMPDDSALHLEAGRRFAEAGDNRSALAHFQAALRHTPANGPALASAGLAAFALGEYPQARRYLRRAPDDIDGVADTRELVNLVVTQDPLAGRVGARERHRRLLDALAYAQQRLGDCVEPSSPGAPPADDLHDLRERAAALDAHLRSPVVADQDTVEDGVDLVERLEEAAVQRCPPATARDRALILIGRRHGADEP